MADEVGKVYTVSDGDLVLRLEVAEEGGFVVTAPMEPGLITEAETIEEAFFMARDAREALREVRQRFIDEAREAMTKAI
ncbi:MAG: type II toxin-antitoxin system HicB family antitoxin [Planctomycetota bacterium]